MINCHTQLQEHTNFQLLHILHAIPELAQREIAQQLGISTREVNHSLKAIIKYGLVKVYNFSQSKKKFGYIYVLTLHGLAIKSKLASRFLKSKLIEYISIQTEIELLQGEVGANFGPSAEKHVKPPK